MADEKITLTALRKQLAKEANISEQEAGTFLSQMFDNIILGLKEDGQVKINGLGTFRLQWNAPRKSVNVQTGEDILIEGYKKVVFTPENTLKDRINEPFAHLEALVIDEEGQTLAQSTAINPLHKLGEQAEEIKDLLADLVDNQEAATEDTEVATTTEEPTTAIAAEEEAIAIEENVEEPVSIEEKAEETTAVEKKEEQPISTEEKVENPVFIEEKAEAQQQQPKGKRPFRPWLVAGITVMIFCLLLVAGYFFVQHKIVAWADSFLENEQQVEAIEEPEMEESLATTIDTTAIVAPIDTSVVKAAQKDEPLVFKEFITTETLPKGSRLSWLARKYYGTPYFWVYIYLANQDQLPNPNVIPQGTKIRVPKLPESIGDPQNEEHIKKAQAIETEILHQ